MKKKIKTGVHNSLQYFVHIFPQIVLAFVHHQIRITHKRENISTVII